MKEKSGCGRPEGMTDRRNGQCVGSANTLNTVVAMPCVCMSLSMRFARLYCEFAQETKDRDKPITCEIPTEEMEMEYKECIRSMLMDLDYGGNSTDERVVAYGDSVFCSQ